MKNVPVWLILALFCLSSSISAKELLTIETEEADIDVQVFPANGNVLLLGFPIDEGKSSSEEKIASSLSEDGIEVWMPDILSALMLPNVRSSLNKIPDELLITIIKEAVKRDKKVFLIATGPDADIVLRSAKAWEETEDVPLAGAILMFPRLFKSTPEPGKVPEYVDSVGTTTLPIMLLEGGRTPNRWGINTLSKELEKNGSNVTAKIIPSIRGKFFKRDDSNRSEDVVSSQMAGLIKVSLYYLSGEEAYEE